MKSSNGVERELKLCAPDNFSLARLSSELGNFTAQPATAHRFHTIYYDTADYRLTRWACSLRYRTGAGWTLKLPVPGDGDVLEREEREFEGDARAIPPEAIDLAMPFTRGAELRPVAELRTLRVQREIHDKNGDDVAEVVEDDVHVVNGKRDTKRFRQIEIELSDGIAGEAVDEIAGLLRREGAGAPDATPKNVRALDSAVGEAELVIPSLDATSTCRLTLRAALAESIETLVRNDAKLRLSRDAEAVHKARVPVRRVRSHLRTFRSLLDRSWSEPLRERLTELGNVLGNARDADVLLGRLERDAAQLPATDKNEVDALLASCRAMQTDAYDRLRRAFHDRRYLELLDDLIRAANEPRFRIDADEPAAVLAAKLIAKVRKRAARRVRAAATIPSDGELHRIRIASKHVRYAAESLEPVVGKRARRLAACAEELQTLLGDQHDAASALSLLREIKGNGQFVAGELALLQHRVSEKIRSRWRRSWSATNRAAKKFG